MKFTGEDFVRIPRSQGGHCYLWVRWYVRDNRIISEMG